MLDAMVEVKIKRQQLVKHVSLACKQQCTCSINCSSATIRLVKTTMTTVISFEMHRITCGRTFCTKCNVRKYCKNEKLLCSTVFMQTLFI